MIQYLNKLNQIIDLLKTAAKGEGKTWGQFAENVTKKNHSII
jgi:hypothetical protein